MVSFFLITFSLISILFVIGLVLLGAFLIYIFDSISIVISDSFLQEYRPSLRNFLNIVVEPIFVISISIILFISCLGLFSKKFRSPITENRFRLQYNPIDLKKVTVALTAYDEEDVIGQSVKEFVSNKLVNKVLVIDNGSKDNTAKIASDAGAEIISIKKNQGYDYACLRCLKESLNTDANIIILCEGDNTFSGKDVQKFLSYIDNADMVVGTRTVRALTEKETQMSQFYIWGNYFIAFLIQLKYFNPTEFTNVRLTDVGCTYRAIRRDSLKKIIDKLETRSHLFSPHMLLVSIENGLSIIEIPISFQKRLGSSKGAGGKKSLGFRVGLEMIWEILRR